MPEVKICGLTRPEDASVAASAGATYGGVILAPGGKRSVDAARAAEIFAGLPLRRVGVFVNADPDELRRSARSASLDVVQLHGDEDPEYVRRLRKDAAWRVWKAVRPRSGDEFAEAVVRFGTMVDGILVDAWSPDARGGTGHRFPWEEVARFLDRLPSELQLIVAGGLHPGNVREAAETLRPSVLDVSSGVETAPGLKDPEAVRSFVAAARAAVSDPSPGGA